MTEEIEVAIRKLELFNRKAKKMENSTFAKKALDEPSGVTINYEAGKGGSAVRHGPDEEAIDAFLLTLRLFWGQNEQISLTKMKKLYEALPVNPQLVAEFKAYSDELDKFIAGRPSDHGKIKVEFNGVEPTRGELIEHIVFGDLAHVDVKKRTKFIEWEENPIAFPYVQNELVVTLATYLNTIIWLRQINEEALQELRTSTN